MNMNLVNMFEAIKRDQFKEIGAYLNNEDIEILKQWHEENTENTGFDMRKAIDLMYYLYIHENIDLYGPSEFRRIESELAKLYGIKELLKLIVSFKETIYGF